MYVNVCGGKKTHPFTHCFLQVNLDSNSGILLILPVLWYPVSLYHSRGQRPTPLLERVWPCFKNADSSSYFSHIILKFLLYKCKFCKQVLALIGYDRSMFCARFLTLIDVQRNILINGGCHPPPPLCLMIFQLCVLCVFFRQWSWQAPVLSFLMNTTPCLSVNQNLFSIRERTWVSATQMNFE